MATMETGMRTLKNLKVELAKGPVIALWMWMCRLYTAPYRDICTSVLTAALVTIAREWNPSRSPSSDDWINKM